MITDGVSTGNFRAKWDNAYYSPDGTAGLPKNGTYVTLTPKTAGKLKATVWAYLTFDAAANETYYIFCKSTQVGFGGFEFTAGTNGISDITADKAKADAPVFNLAGQRVSKNAKGILIQNGKKFIVK